MERKYAYPIVGVVALLLMILVLFILSILGLHSNYSTGDVEIKNCTLVNLTTNPEFDINETLVYERTLFGVGFPPRIDYLQSPIMLAERYTVKDMEIINFEKCWIISSMRQNILTPDDDIRVNNDTFSLCENINNSCDDLFLYRSDAINSLYLTIHKDFDAKLTTAANYNLSTYIFGYVIQEKNEKYSLNDRYEVVKEEKINGIDCYKLNITMEMLCFDGYDVQICPSKVSILWIDKKRRVLIKKEVYFDGKLIERKLLVNSHQ